MFRIKLYTCPCQRCSEGSNKTFCTPGNPTEPEPDLLLSVWVSPVQVWISSALLLGQGLWVQQTWGKHKPSWRWSPLTPQQSTQNWGNRLLECRNKTLCAPGPRRKEQWPPQETDPDLPVSIQEFLFPFCLKIYQYMVSYMTFLFLLYLLKFFLFHEVQLKCHYSYLESIFDFLSQSQMFMMLHHTKILCTHSNCLCYFGKELRDGYHDLMLLVIPTCLKY